MKKETLQKGFTLVEVLVVASIAAVITGFLITNFSRLRTSLNQTQLALVDALREAQSLALSGAAVQGGQPCGYGVHFLADRYLVYAGPDSGSNDCSVQDPNYESGTDTVIRTGLLPNESLELAPPFVDIFFEPPNPTTYIGGSSTPGATTTVTVRKKGEPCPGPDCRTILITSAGRIQAQ